MLPRFYPIIDTGHLSKIEVDPIEFAATLLNAGVRIAQYRHKGEFTRSRFEEVDAIAQAFREAEVPFILNDRADIALAVGASGVHLGQEDLAPADVRRIIGPDMLLGYSTHNTDQLRVADSEPVDYLAIGPMFGTASKENPDQTVAPQLLPEMRRLTAKPLVAIGGISLGNAALLFDGGVDSVAVISAISEDNLGEWLQST